MPTTRVTHDGTIDFVGHKVGTLRVDGIAGRFGNERRFTVRCEQCGAQGTTTHSKLRHGSAKCQNGACGKTERSRVGETLGEQRRRLAELEAERVTAERASAVARMEAESDGWERPTRYAPAPDPRPAMTAREVIAARERRAAAEAEQRLLDAPRLEAERAEAEDRKAAEAQKRALAERQRAYWAQWVSEDRDPQFFITPAMITASMPKKDADAYNVAEVEKFTEGVPEYAGYKTPENAALIVAYLRKNGASIYDAQTLKAAFIRLRELGILTKASTAVEQSFPQPQPTSVEVKTEGTPAPKLYRGRDYATGLERDFTAREIERMSSAEYRKAFAIVPTVSELFSQMREADE